MRQVFDVALEALTSFADAVGDSVVKELLTKRMEDKLVVEVNLFNVSRWMKFLGLRFSLRFRLPNWGE